MYRKLIAAVLAALLLLCCVSALAEDVENLSVSSTFDIELDVPDGYAFTRSYVDDMLVATLTPDTPDRPAMTICIAFDELLEGKTLNDMSAEDVAAIVEATNRDFVDPENSTAATAPGTQVLITVERTASDSYADLTTVYRGYYITLYIVPEEGGIIGQDDLDLGLSVLSGMSFKDA